jgi:hypothetical protein
MNDVGTEGSEPVRRIEARLAHRAVALVEQVGEAIGGTVVELRDVVIRDVVRAKVLANPVVMRESLRVALGRDDFRRRSVAEIEVA